MGISQRGLDLIRRFEGLELGAYQDSAGVWTIGYGHTGPDVFPGMQIDEATAVNMLWNDIRRSEGFVSEMTAVPLEQHQFDALVSFVFNVGEEAFKQSTLLEKLNAGDYAGAADEFLRWDKASVNGEKVSVLGLTRRRRAERDVFLGRGDIAAA